MMRGRAFINAVIIGASPESDRIRRELAQRGVVAVQPVRHLRHLRRAIITADAAGAGPLATLMFISLDESTHQRYGPALRTFIEDLDRRSNRFLTIGVLNGGAFSSQDAALGLDMHTACADEAIQLVRTVVGRYATRRAGSLSPLRDATPIESERHDRDDRGVREPIHVHQRERILSEEHCTVARIVVTKRTCGIDGEIDAPQRNRHVSPKGGT